MLLQVIDIVSHPGVRVDKIGWGKLTSRPSDGCSTSFPLLWPLYHLETSEERETQGSEEEEEAAAGGGCGLLWENRRGIRCFSAAGD